MTIKELATFLHCSMSNIRNMVKTNEIPHFRLGYRIYFNKNTIETWLHNKEMQSLNNNGIDLKLNQIKSVSGSVIDMK